MLSNISRRKGVTPVIAVLLLLMMTVAAAGGAYAWINTLMEEFQQEGEDELDQMDKDIDVHDIACNEDNEFEVYLENSGGTTFSLYPVDITVYNAYSGDIHAELLDQDLSEGIYGNNIEEPRDRAQYEYSISDDQFYTDVEELVAGNHYDIVFDFSEDDYQVVASCVSRRTN